MTVKARQAKVLIWRCRADGRDAVVCLTPYASRSLAQTQLKMTFLMPALPTRHVFVYGTLRRGEQRDINLLKPSPRWVGRASVEGVLHDLGEYPGLVLASDQRPGQKNVRGEVYEISNELEHLLDEIEGVAPRPNDEYAKREVLVHLESARTSDESGLGHAVTCLVYEVTPGRVAGRPVISSGDWVDYRLQHKAGDGS